MPEETKQPETLSPEVHDVMRTLITAIRIVKLYPQNNPIYSQSVNEAHEALSRFLKSTPEYYVVVQKAFFTYRNTPIGKDTEGYKAIAQDLFTKGIRNITFSKDVAVKEMMDLFQTLALQTKEIAMHSGVSSILWGKGVSNIKVTESGLEDIITSTTGSPLQEMTRKTASTGATELAFKLKTAFTEHTLVLDDILNNHSDLGAAMVALARDTKGENESVEDRLISLYQEAGRKILEEQPDRHEAMFKKLAQSVLSIEQPHRDALIAGKLYTSVDLENIEKRKPEIKEQVPSGVHEILSGRFLSAWTAQQVAVLLKKLTAQEIKPPSSESSAFTAIPLESDTKTIAEEATQYTAQETEYLKVISSAGMESDIIEASVRTLIFLIPLVKSPHHATPDDKDISLFSSVIHQLEDMLSYLLEKKDYKNASLITSAFNTPVDPAFKPRMLEALRKTSSKTFITSTIADLQKCAKGSPEYVSAYSYLSAMEREATEVLLEMLAKETSITAKAGLINLLKEIGKNQISMLGNCLSDSRFSFVHDILTILGEIKSDEAVIFLQKAAENKNVKIRQEAVKGLISIGGKKSAVSLAKFLKDEERTIQLTAIRGFTAIKEITPEETRPLIAFLRERPLNKDDQPLTLEAIKVLSKIGDISAEEVLSRYLRTRWWKSHKLQAELKDAATKAIAAITRRKDNAGSAKR
jgi:hypothetical protein